MYFFLVCVFVLAYLGKYMAFFKNSRVYHSLLQAVSLRSKVLNSKQFGISVPEL